MIPYARQNITEEDIDNVVRVLRSDYLTQGEIHLEFEQKMAKRLGVKYSVTANSATSALHLACLALGLGSGDLLWTTPITFVSSANCARYCGAKVDFVDIDPFSWNISIEALAKKLEIARNYGRLPKVIIAVHFCGLSCDMKALHKLSKEYGFQIIEDASHALGARYRGNYVGSCLYSDITVFSFHPVKIITTGEGGMAVSNNKTLVDRMVLLRSHGITRDPSLMTHEPDGPWYYEQLELGFNYRMTEFQAALGISQLNRLDDFITKRHQLAEQYDSLLAELPLQLPFHSYDDFYSSLHLYVIRVKKHSVEGHRKLFLSLRKQGIGVNIHYIPVHTQPYYKKLGFSEGDFPNAENYYREAITLPLFPMLTDGELRFVVKALKKELI
jgi:UDP-4-amino-4,6-dideoxy-N-acetyl-beta-L-altrosamine transaminase